MPDLNEVHPLHMYFKYKYLKLVRRGTVPREDKMYKC